MTLSVNHDYRSHLWCGIGALSAAAGIPTTQAHRMFLIVSLRRHIKAVSYSEMAHAIAALGYQTQREFCPRDASECLTLKDWLEREYRPSDHTYVICITGHWIVVRNDEWVCSMNQKARHVSDCPYLRARVRHVVSFDHTVK